ncbi:MAG: hypothetical protein DWH77_00385 [Planctomycetota bacterium]|nr:MAG: hypothetical protein DWH77_00385 [Planctomycetota bacterium]
MCSLELGIERVNRLDICPIPAAAGDLSQLSALFESVLIRRFISFYVGIECIRQMMFRLQQIYKLAKVAP